MSDSTTHRVPSGYRRGPWASSRPCSPRSPGRSSATRKPRCGNASPTRAAGHIGDEEASNGIAIGDADQEASADAGDGGTSSARKPKPVVNRNDRARSTITASDGTTHVYYRVASSPWSPRTATGSSSVGAAASGPPIEPTYLPFSLPVSLPLLVVGLDRTCAATVTGPFGPRRVYS